MQTGTEREARERKTKENIWQQILYIAVCYPLGNPLMPIASLQRHNLHPGMSIQGCFA